MLSIADYLIPKIEKYKEHYESLVLDADQNLRPYLLDKDSDRSTESDALIFLRDDAADRANALLQSNSICLSATFKLDWRAEVLEQRDLIANVELEILRTCKQYLIDSKFTSLMLPRWGNMYWRETVGFLPQYHYNKDYFDDIKFSLLPRNDLHAWTTYDGQTEQITLDTTIEPVLTVANTVFMLFLAEIRAARRPKIRAYFQIFLQVFEFILGERSLEQTPLFCPVDLASFNIGQNATKSQIQFLMAHELGHVKLNHNKSDTVETVGVYGGRNAEILGFQRGIAQELEADLYAAQFVRDAKFNKYLTELQEEQSKAKEIPSLMSSQTLVELERLTGTIESLFFYLAMFEAVSDLVIGPKSSLYEEHPPAMKRLENIRRMKPVPYNRISTFSSMLETFSGQFSEYINKTSERWSIEDITASLNADEMKVAE